MQQRQEFLEAAIRGEHHFTELCRRFGISRKNGYKWLNRYKSAARVPAARSLFERPVSSAVKSLADEDRVTKVEI